MGEQITYDQSNSKETSTLLYFPKKAFDFIERNDLTLEEKTELFSLIVRYNTLYMISRAGSGHIGSSFSSIDIVSWLYLNKLSPHDRYYSSKGHDAPGLYNVQIALGILPFETIHQLRKIDGLPGHPDIVTPGAFTNTGSLGMGVSKAMGFLFADGLLKNEKSNVYVLTGDGELQEGQFWESLIKASRLNNKHLTIIVDHNKLQSDTFVSDVSDLGDLEAKFTAFGFEAHRINGHDYKQLSNVFSESKGDTDKPRVIIADTIKGKGVSFMEHTSMDDGQEYYQYHSGAPSYEEYVEASEELHLAIKNLANKLEVTIPDLITAEYEPPKLNEQTDRFIPAYSDCIVEEASKNKQIVALDADLVLDTGLIDFKNSFPDRFVECGIAEQDMVSQAGTMALSGLLPMVHSFSCFLTSRASEQIYNNCTQGGKIIYSGSLAGILPGGPGSSHQAIRDIAAMSAMPGITILEPTCSNELKMCMRWAIHENKESTYLRLTSIPFEMREEFKMIKKLEPGKGTILRDGDDLTILTIGPILTVEALKASDLLYEENGLQSKVISFPWANRFDREWFIEHFEGNSGPLIVLENHYVDGGFGEKLSRFLISNRLAEKRSKKFIGITKLPACGTNTEVLQAHNLDFRSLKAITLKLYEKQ